MLQSYLLIALRTMRRRSFSTLLNVAGLALGMAVFLFLAEFTAFHWGFDRFHANAERIYRIVGTTPNGAWDKVPPILLTLPDHVTGLDATPALMTSASGVVSYKPSTEGAQALVFKEEAVAYGNNDLFRAFSFPIRAGSAELDKPNTMVLEASTAQKYFGCGENYQSILGKQLQLSNQFGTAEYVVTGVMADISEQSHLRGTMLFSLQTLANPANLAGNDWAQLVPTNTSSFLDGYVMLKKGVAPSAIETQLEELRKKVDAKADVRWHLQPVTSIHPGNGFSDPLPNEGALKLVAVASAIALFVLALAWMNYVSLSTAFGLSRAREIGVRKVMGASRGQLMTQHLLECAVVSVVALLLALSLVELLQTPFNELVGAKLSLAMLASPSALLAASAVLVFGTLVAGGYVALVLTGVETSAVLRGNFARSSRGGRTRTVLVVMQFAVSIAFIIGTLVVFQQLNFMRHKDLGMNLDQLLVIEGPSVKDVANSAQSSASRTSVALAFKQEAARLPFVRAIAGSQNVPGKSYNFNTTGIMRPTGERGDEKKQYRMFIADEHFFDTYNMKFAAGTGYKTADNLGDLKVRFVAVNEAAAKQLGFRSSDEAVGAFVQWGEANGDDKKGQRFQICGVVKNYHHKSLKDAIDPIMFLPSEASGYFTIRLSADNVRGNITTLETLYKRLFPGNPFNYSFSDEMFQKQYEQDTKVGRVFAVFTGVAIVIACLGLFGLVAFMTQQRKKEIGVRKVLGASVFGIVGLLSKDFLKLVLFAIVVAAPLAWWAMNAWLQGFAYRVELNSASGVGVFVLAGALAVGIAVLTVSYQAWWAARANPVEALRSE